jgi:hypothetical protein
MNIAKLNTASLDDKTYIIKRGTSGGTPDTPSGESDIEYLDLRNVTTLIGGAIPLKSLLGSMGYVTKFQNPNNDLTTILNSASLYSSLSSQQIATLDFYGVEIDFSSIFGGNANDGIKTILDVLLEYGITAEQLDAIPRITKEQFYSLE